jgi:hypothetical protein
MSDFKHVEEQIARLKERGARERLLSVLDAADTMQALLDVARAAQENRKPQTLESYERTGIKVDDALTKLQEQKR